MVKIRDCLGVHLTAEQTQRCIQLVDSLEILEAAQITELMALLS